MKIARLSILFAFLLMVLAACVKPPRDREIVHTPKPKSDDLLASYDDCAHAKENIAALEAEKTMTEDKVKHGVKMVMPMRTVVKMLYGQYSHERRVTTGQYNDDLDRKIKEIRMMCDVW